MTLSELGVRLRQAREERQMTLAEVVDRLKIPTRILEGLEEGSDYVPRTVYVRHFIKEYARLLGIRDEEIAEWLENLEGFEGVSYHAAEESAPYTSVKPSMLPVVLSGLLKVILIAVLAFGAYTAYVHFFASRVSENASVTVPSPHGTGSSPWGDSPAAPAESAPAAVEVTPAPAPVPAAPVPAPSEGAPEAAPSSLAETPVTAAGTTTPAPAAGSTASATVEEAAPVAVESSAAPAEPAPAVQPAPAEPAPVALPDGMHQVEVIAVDGDCWMGFEPDGRHQQRTLRKGDTFSMTFRDSLVVRLGNAQAVRIIYDGKELERSTSTRVVTMRFPMQP